jgi:hypothetical protein
VAGRTPREAVRNFVDTLQRALACVTPTVVDVGGGYYPAEEPHRLTLRAGEPVRLRGVARISLSVRMRYRIVEAPGPGGPWNVNIVAYQHALWDRDGREIVAYHWHPDGESDVITPHVHLGAGAAVGHAGLRDAHLPSGLVTLDDVLRLALVNLGAEPLRRDWREVLEASRVGLQSGYP